MAEQSEEGTTVTREMLEAAFAAIENQQAEPHTCIVHPNGGICLDCGQPWRRVDGRMEPVVFGSSGGEG